MKEAYKRGEPKLASAIFSVSALQRIALGASSETSIRAVQLGFNTVANIHRQHGERIRKYGEMLGNIYRYALVSANEDGPGLDIHPAFEHLRDEYAQVILTNVVLHRSMDLQNYTVDPLTVAEEVDELRNDIADIGPQPTESQILSLILSGKMRITPRTER